MMSEGTDVGITSQDLAELFRINPLANEQVQRIATQRLLAEALAKFTEFKADESVKTEA
jgi:hypothetical protein